MVDSYVSPKFGLQVKLLDGFLFFVILLIG